MPEDPGYGRGEKTADAVLEAFKAQRFLEVGAGGPEPARVPESSGLLRVYTFSLNPIPFQKGIPIILPKVIPSISPTDILVRWELNPANEKEPRTLAIYEGRPFAGEAGNIIDVPPPTPGPPIIGIGDLRGAAVLSVAARAVATADHTILFFNGSKATEILTESVEVSCLCTIEQP